MSGGGHRRRALGLGGVVEAPASGGRIGAAGVDEHDPQLTQPAALARQQDRRGGCARGGEAGRADRLLTVADQQPDVGAPALLQPGRDARRPEAGGQAGVWTQVAHVRRRGHPARAEEGPHGAHPRPAFSGWANITFRFWTACEEVPFQRLSIEEKTSTLPVWPSAAANRRQKFVASTSRVPGGLSATSTKGSST